ncbi:hypothetical protein [Streptomyces sp. HUAS TT20]|uniref:hypothetical protein n=1 Tax=Streptomyces sp. HUAS TT20 TaxID=3447509 RepID=UPI0021D9BEDF|nr:hypothetical protein [Streptomyces sp. HUAS 15-9]UXY30832.1 hypothetical protein N8I87_32625 [Streptomyces sp. HUAS 15-9]
MTRYQRVVAAAGPLAASAALVFGGTAAGATTSGLPYGPGSQAHYTVQKQSARGVCHYRSYKNQPLPDSHCTPGALNPKVTARTLRTTICNPGYSSKIRPPASVTGAEKSANATSYSYRGSLHDAESDHLVSLSLGGDPNDPRNLWVEPPSPGRRPGAGPNNDKDKVEARLHTAICSGRVTLASVQKAIATNWVTAEAELGLK